MKARGSTTLLRGRTDLYQHGLRVNGIGMLFVVALLGGCTTSPTPPDQTVDEGDSVALRESVRENQPPSAQAGPDQTVYEDDNVTLNGIASDPDGSIETYRWEQIVGPPVSISNGDQAVLSFVAPEVDRSIKLTFRLTVADDTDATASDDVVVTIMEYGRQRVLLSGTVTSHSTYKKIPGAAITVSQYKDGISRVVGVADTNRGGKYSVRVRANPGRLTVNAAAEGYAPQSAIVDLAGGSKLTADLKMVSVQVTQKFQPEKQAEIRVGRQKVVSLSVNSLVTPKGSVASGETTAMVTVLDASKDPSVMPGELERWNEQSGEVEPIESFGAMNVVFKGAKGERLNLKSGKRAGISIPLASGRRPEDSPSSIPLFYWSDTRGYWVEEGEAVLEEITAGKWAYTGNVGHFSTWNADSAYESVMLRGCVNDRNGKPVRNAELTARGSDYVGSSKATTHADGRFEIQVRPDSELEVFAVAAGPLYSEARTVRTGSAEMEIGKCLVVTGDQGLKDFPMKITGTTGSLEICVRDHECEDGDRISVTADGRTVFSGEIVNDWVCKTLEVEHGRSYPVELTALNGTGHKGNCSYADANTGEIRVTGENTETQVWRHRGGAGSKALITVESTGYWSDSLGIEFVPIPPGEFRMGSTSRVADDNEQPVTQVRISKGFYLGKYEVTQAQWKAVMGSNPSRFDACGPNCPVENVSWNDAQAFIKKLNSKDGKQRYRLPTEAEWEYAARAGSVTAYSWGNEIGRNRANCRGCGSQWDGEKTAPVGSFSPNAWGLHDMHGNVWEWVQDCWNDTYHGAPTDGSAWTSGSCGRRVVRGGSWSNGPENLRAAFRLRNTTGSRYNDSFGFRVARTLTP